MLLFLQEYVDLYTDWLLNKSIEKSFDAFKRGFDLVLGQSCLADLFTAEEVELLICGSNVSDSHLVHTTQKRVYNFCLPYMDFV